MAQVRGRLNDAGSSTRDLWSADKIASAIASGAGDSSGLIAFTTTYKGVGPIREYVGEYDASAGGVPTTFTLPDGTSFTASTAKYGDIAVISVAGTVSGVAVSKNDHIQANRNGPTLAAHWNVIKDCTTEWVAALEAAAGQTLLVEAGFYRVTDCNPDAPVRFEAEKEGTVAFGALLDHTTLYQTANVTYAIANTSQSKCSAASLNNYTDPVSLSATDNITTFACQTIGQAANFKKDTYAVVFTDNPNPSYASSPKNYIAQQFKILDSDAATGNVYATERLRWHTEIAAATNIYINTINSDRSANIQNIVFQGLPTMIGESSGWWNSLYGREVAGTVSGSGSTRTITKTAHQLSNGNLVQVGNDSGATTTTCVVSAVTANTFVITIPSTQDMSGSAPGLDTSGDIFYRPVFDHTDTAHHGFLLVLEHANESVVEACTFDAMWVGGIKKRHSGRVKSRNNTYRRYSSALTKSANSNGRIGYGEEDYGLATYNDTEGMTSEQGRHVRTNGIPTTSSSWAAGNWYRYGGAATDCSYRNVLARQGNASAIDNHAGERGLLAKDWRVEDANRGSHAGAYYGFDVQCRSPLTLEGFSSEGSTNGIRVQDGEFSDVIAIDASISNLNFRSTYGVTTRSAALRVEAQTGTAKPKVIGCLRAYNAGMGVHVADAGLVDLDFYSHDAVTQAGAYVYDTGIFRAKHVVLDFTADPASLTPRYAFYMEDASRVDVEIMEITLGAAHNPTAIFADGDNVSGKIANIGVLIVRDPGATGLPTYVTSGREANFTLNIGLVIYNGVVILSRLGSATYSSIQHLMNFALSPGISSGGAITASATANAVDVAAGTGFIKATDSNVATLNFFNWSASAAVSVPSGSTRYLGVQYNSGSPNVVAKTTDSWDLDTEFPLGVAVNEGGTRYISNIPWITADNQANIIERFDSIAPVARDNRTGGLILSGTGTRKVAVSAGALLSRMSEFSIAAIDTNVSGSFDAYYQDGASGWTKESAATQWNNDKYDDGDGTLGSLTVLYYTSRWFYLMTDGTLAMLYGRAQYATLAAALNDAVPSSAPDRIVKEGILIGRFIIQASGSSPTVTQTAFGTAFTAGGVTNFSDLAGTAALTQGGTGATTASAAATALGVGTGDSPQFTGINLGHASDTTLTRTGAGDIAVEGNAVYRAGGTDVPVTDGGTGASTAAGAATALGLGTGDSPQFTGINVGHASDTTLTRSGAGDIAVEGNGVYRAAGTDVAVADGGTGSSTAAAARIALGFAGMAALPVMSATMHAAGNASITMTDMAAAAAFPGGTAGNRMIKKVDLSACTQGRIFVHMNTTAGVSGSSIAMRYSTTFTTTPGSYSQMGTGATEINALLDTASTIADSGWVTLTAAAIADGIFVAPIGINGDGVADPVVSSIWVMFR